jgi:hypothetical protein
MKLHLRERRNLLLFGCALHGEPNKGETAKRLAAEGKGRWKVCTICHALCVLDAFEAVHVKKGG